MATTIDKHYATEDEKKPFVNDEQPFSNKYERISNVKSSTSETYEPYTESQMLRDPRMVSVKVFSLHTDHQLLTSSVQCQMFNVRQKTSSSYNIFVFTHLKQYI